MVASRRIASSFFAGVVWAAVVLAPARAEAQHWFAIPGLGISFASEYSLLDLEVAEGRSKLTYQGSVLWLGEGWLGLEGEVGYIDAFFEREGVSLVTSSGVITVMGSVVVATPLSLTGYSLRPYATAGFGLMNARVEDIFNALPVRTNLAGIRLGGGAIGFFTDTVGVRWDLSYFRSLDGQGNDGGVAIGSRALEFWRGAMGLVLRF